MALTTHSSAALQGGTARWQAPELFGEEEDEMVQNTVQSDIYAMACVFYEVSHIISYDLSSLMIPRYSRVVPHMQILQALPQ